MRSGQRRGAQFYERWGKRVMKRKMMVSGPGVTVLLVLSQFCPCPFDLSSVLVCYKLQLACESPHNCPPFCRDQVKL